MPSILSRWRLSISKRGYHSRAPTAIKLAMFYSSLQAAISNGIYSNINFKVKQVVCLEAIYHGRDVVAILPTGYGKSMIFHLLPSLFLDKNIKCASRVAPSPVIIVVSPLNALIKDQIRRLKEGNVKATVLSVKGKSEDLELDSSDANPAELRDAKYEIVFAHPEAFLSCKKGIELLQSETYQRNVHAIVIDEAHCILDVVYILVHFAKLVKRGLFE